MEPNLPPIPPLPPSAPLPYPAPRPQYTPPPPPSGRRPLFYVAIIGGCCGVPVALLGVLGAVLFPVFAQAREKARFTACLSNVKTTTLATIQYAQDWDEKYPPAKRWMTNLEPYINGAALDPSKKSVSRFRLPVYDFHCPNVAPRHAESDKYGYALNSLLNGKSIREVDAPGKFPMIYDSKNTQKNASDPFKSVAYRHLHAASVGYADGHARSERAKTASGSE